MFGDVKFFAYGYSSQKFPILNLPNFWKFTKGEEVILICFSV